MKRFGSGLAFLLAASVLFAPAAFAQSGPGDAVNVGIFGNVFDLNGSKITLGGIGGRVSVKLWPRIQFEGETSYNFEEAFSQGFNDANGTLTVSRTQVRILDGLFGPKISTSKGPVRFFATFKGGFANFNLENSLPVTVQTVASNFAGLSGVNTFGAIYPGIGAEGFWGFIGVRADVGDEIFFNRGTHHDVRVSLGPVIRF